MARFLLVGSDGVEVRAVNAPDIEVARTRLGPRGGQFVVSAASWAVSQLVRIPDPLPDGPSPYKGRTRLYTPEGAANRHREAKRQYNIRYRARKAS